MSESSWALSASISFFSSISKVAHSPSSSAWAISGMPMKAFVRASTAEAIAHHRALREGAEVFRRVFADPELENAIQAAGLDDGPVPGTASRAA